MKSERDANIFQIGFPQINTATPNKTAPQSQMPVKRSTPVISLEEKRRFPSFHFSPRRLIIPIFCIILAFCLIYSYTETKLAPKMTELARSSAEKHLLATVNQTVGEMADEGLLDYGKMVSTIRDEKGEVIYLEVDTGMLAKAKSILVSRIAKRLEENKKIPLSVPLGSLTDWNLFSGVGIPMKIKLYPIESVEGEIHTELEDCGINQTRHLIEVTVQAKLLVVLPGENVEAKTQVRLPLGERVLVGDVPEIYLDTIGAN